MVKNYKDESEDINVRIETVRNSAKKMMEIHPELRYGQCIWDCMFSVFNPSLIEPYRGTSLDPFYVDSRVEPFFDDFKLRYYS